jgi:hypothetical protein
LLLTLVGAVAVLGVRSKRSRGLLRRRRRYGLWLLVVAALDVLWGVVPLLQGGLFLQWTGWTLWGWSMGVTTFPVTVVVFGVPLSMGTAVIYDVQVGVAGVVLGESLSPVFPMGSIAAAAWVAAAVVPLVVALDLLTAVGAFAVVVASDWVRLRAQSDTAKRAVSSPATAPNAPV